MYLNTKSTRLSAHERGSQCQESAGHPAVWAVNKESSSCHCNAYSLCNKLWRARSRLFRSRFLRANVHVAAFFKIYNGCACCTLFCRDFLGGFSRLFSSWDSKTFAPPQFQNFSKFFIQNLDFPFFVKMKVSFRKF